MAPTSPTHRFQKFDHEGPDAFEIEKPQAQYKEGRMDTYKKKRSKLLTVCPFILGLDSFPLTVTRPQRLLVPPGMLIHSTCIESHCHRLLH